MPKQESKEPKAPKVPKVPKAPKAPKAPKPPKVPKPSKACARVLTLPQLTGVCWWTALLTAILSSQHSNKMLRRLMPLHKADGKKDRRLGRIYELLHSLIVKYHAAKSETERAKAYKEHFASITPEHLLETLHTIDPSTFKFNPIIHQGFHAAWYIPVFYRLLKVRPLFLDAAYDSEIDDYIYYVSHYNNFDMIYSDDKTVKSAFQPLLWKQVEALMATDSYDTIVVFYNDIKTAISERTDVSEHLNRHIAKDALVPHSLTFNKQTYELDANVLASFHNEACGHAIAGITCNKKHHVYNGWVRSMTRDAAMGDSPDSSPGSKNTEPRPCELMPFDWNKDASDFCLNLRACGLDKVDKPGGLCFSFKKGQRMCIYVNNKFAKPRFKLSAENAQARRSSFSLGPEAEALDAKWDSNKRLCVRRVANWSSLKPYHKFDTATFDRKQLLKDLPTTSPKLQKLLDTIEELDAADREKHNHLHKHFIFSDLSHGYGAKIVASALLAKGYELAYDKKHAILPPQHHSNSKRFALLSSSTVYEKPLTVKMKKALLARYNSRPDNVYGKDIRIIVLDAGFKEGIDLFDVKYVHIFEPQLSSADQRQVIGRATRTCGQKGLAFDPAQGWPLEVRIYDSALPRVVRDRKFDIETMHELYLAKSGIDLRFNNFVSDLEKHVTQAAVDGELNKAVHTGSLTGGASTPELYKRLQKEATKKFAKTGKWIVKGMENLCVTPPATATANAANAAAANSLSFNPSQEFMRYYMNPSMPTNGVLAFWSTGSGKTCQAIATASTSFENAGYTILWVTRTTLKADMWKNMFDQVCNVNLQGTMPKEMAERRRLLSKAWQIPPMSYKQFTNMLQGRNEFYHKLVSINGAKDPLRKTLLIIDEAHKLFNAEDLKSVERPDTPTLYKMLRNSYELSGKESVKLLLMTATPITNNPMDFVRLMNLFKPESKALPDDFEEFFAQYLDAKTGKFTKESGKRFMNSIAGIVSYLNRERDARQFAQPKIKIVRTEISKRVTEVETPEQLKLKFHQQQSKLTRMITELKGDLKAAKVPPLKDNSELVALKEKIAELMAAKKEIKKKDEKALLQGTINDLKSRVQQHKDEIKAAKAKSADVSKTIKVEIAAVQKKLNEARKEKSKIRSLQQIDMAQERMLSLCSSDTQKAKKSAKPSTSPKSPSSP